jgi:hypothetical protein
MACNTLGCSSRFTHLVEGDATGGDEHRDEAALATQENARRRDTAMRPGMNVDEDAQDLGREPLRFAVLPWSPHRLRGPEGCLLAISAVPAQ